MRLYSSNPVATIVIPNHTDKSEGLGKAGQQITQQVQSEQSQVMFRILCFKEDSTNDDYIMTKNQRPILKCTNYFRIWSLAGIYQCQKKKKKLSRAVSQPNEVHDWPGDSMVPFVVAGRKENSRSGKWKFPDFVLVCNQTKWRHSVPRPHLCASNAMEGWKGQAARKYIYQVQWFGNIAMRMASHCGFFHWRLKYACCFTANLPSTTDVATKTPSTSFMRPSYHIFSWMRCILFHQLRIYCNFKTIDRFTFCCIKSQYCDEKNANICINITRVVFIHPNPSCKQNVGHVIHDRLALISPLWCSFTLSICAYNHFSCYFISMRPDDVHRCL